jgi:hypothetical protein
MINKQSKVFLDASKVETNVGIGKHDKRATTGYKRQLQKNMHFA